MQIIKKNREIPGLHFTVLIFDSENMPIINLPVMEQLFFYKWNYGMICRKMLPKTKIIWILANLSKFWKHVIKYVKGLTCESAFVIYIDLDIVMIQDTRYRRRLDDLPNLRIHGYHPTIEQWMKVDMVW